MDIVVFIFIFLDSMDAEEENQENASQSGTSYMPSGRFKVVQ